jgi:L-2-hydroxyglutarate oxidase LhgO
VRGTAAILSGSTGIIDPVQLTESLVAAARAIGAEVVCSAEVRAIRDDRGGYALETTRGDLGASAVVNAAGLWADDVARLAGITAYTLHPCRGDYYRLKKRIPVERLVYPVKKSGSAGLGVHLTLDLGGNMKLGPDAYYVDTKRDQADPPEAKRAAFAASAARILEGIRAEDLEYDTFGIRPKLRSPSDKEEKDFVIAEDKPRFVNLVGIESPGLTSALAIAEEVEAMLT